MARIGASHTWLEYKIQDENEMLSDWKRHKPLLKGGRYFPLAGGDRPEISDSNWDVMSNTDRNWSVERAGWLLSGVKDDASLDEEEDGS